jgi:Carboxypeptidase regulatory-like domain/TonB-dependent Receptor Plug Domain
MNRLGRWFLLTLLVVSLLAVPMVAQKTSGTIRGVVTDPSGAVVPSVPVVVKSNATGQERTVSTNAQGEYVAPELSVGMYTVTVKAPNFKEATSASVEVHTSDTTVFNVQLQVGSTSEQVTVAASEIQVQTDNAGLGEVVTGEQVRELPLNGRSFVQLTQLQPGVSAANSYDSKNKGLLSGVDFAVNGNSYTSNLFLIDGANNNDVGSNRTILLYPSIEAISEFKMLRNSYGAEYGTAAGAVINIVTKSGTNQWHGDVLYFGRNTALNAWDYFAAGAKSQDPNNPFLTKQIEQRNDYGFSIGGPIKKDKLFIFYSQEWNKEKRGATRSFCVPSAAERAGDFTNPSCGATQPTNLVQYGLASPATPYKLNTIDPSGALLAAEFPLPNLAQPLANGNNWVLSPTSPIDWSEFNIRVDYNLSHANTLMFRWTQDSWTNNAPNLYTNLWGDDPWPSLESNWSQPSKQVMGRLTSTIGTTMVNDLEFAYSDNRINITPGGTNPALLPATTAAIPPQWPLAFKTFPVGIPTIWGGFGAYGNGQNLWMIAPWTNALDIYTVRDDFSKVLGAHTIRFGGFLGWNGKHEMNGANSTQYPTFGTADWDTNLPTGNQLANVLVPGAQWGFSEPSVNLDNQIRWRDYEAYVADTWKARRNLTIDVGVRYSVLNPPFNPDNKMANFIPSLYNPALGSDACNGVWVPPGTSYCTQANSLYGTNFSPGIPGPNKYLIYSKYNIFSPRLGISWDPRGDGNSAIRAGFGIFYQRDRTSPLGYAGTNNVPFVLNANYTRTLVGPPPPGLPTGGASPTGGVNPASIVPYSMQWNFAVEHAFTKSTTLEVAYVGNHAVHVLNDYDANYVQPQNWLAGAFLGGSAINSLRLFGNGNWGNLSEWVHNGSASYNSLQALFKYQVQKFQLQAAYTYSHSIGDVQLDDSSGGLGWHSYLWGVNPSLNRGNTQINRPQIFIANLVYYLPDLKGQNELVQSIAGGWELGAITQYASGTSTTFSQNGVSEDSSHTIGGANGGLASLFGVGYTNTQRPLATGQSCSAGTGGSQVLNPGAATLVGYEIGTIPNNLMGIGSCAGPGLVNTDFSIDKNWRVWGERLRIQFRFDMFNLFNHANFNGGGSINGTQGGSIANNVNCGPANSAGLYQVCSPTNNIITRETLGNTVGQATQAKNAREMQYGLKIIF